MVGSFMLHDFCAPAAVRPPSRTRLRPLVVGRWNFRAFARLNNIANVNYVGTVIVGDTNGRYFEPSATRNFLIGLSAYATF